MPGTAHVLRVSLQFPIMEVKASPKPSRMDAFEAKRRGLRMQERPQGASNGIVLSQLRYPVTVLRKAVAPLRRSNTKARGNLPVRARRQANINRVRRAFGGPACNTRLSPLSIISSARVLGIYVLKDVRFTREICCVFRRTEQTVRGDHRVAEVSRRHS